MPGSKRIYVFVAVSVMSTRAFQHPTPAAVYPQLASSSRRTVVVSDGKIHELGLSLKTRGMEYRDRMQSAQGVNKVGFFLGSALNFILFAVYRAYRGFFVILPAVFVEVRRKLERDELASLQVSDDVDPKTGKLKMRSAILMNIGACVFTLVLVIRTAIVALLSLFFKPRTSPDDNRTQDTDKRDSTLAPT